MANKLKSRLVSIELGESVFEPVAITHEKFIHFLGFRRQNLWWYTPQAGIWPSESEHVFMFLIAQDKFGKFHSFVPIQSDGYRLHLLIDNAQLHIQADKEHSQGNETHKIKLVHVVSENPIAGMQLGIERARGNVSVGAFSGEQWWQKLGWCSWDAFYHRVNQQGVLRSIDTLSAAGHQPGFVIIDDGWQSHVDKRLLETDADKACFPNGLSGIVSEIKNRGDIKVGVWHTLHGYWCGVSHGTELASNVALVNNETWLWDGDEGCRTSIVAPEHVTHFYDNYYARLSAFGVDFTKVDGQAFTERFIIQKELLSNYVSAYQDALRGASEKHMSGQSVHCMAHEPLLIQQANPNVWRNTDDYFPKQSTQHRSHIYQNVMNNMWSAVLGVPDWDMFQTCHPNSEFHAVARAISGGPVYISDEPNKHDATLLNKLTVHGNQVLRPESAALPSPASLFSDCLNLPELLLATNVYQQWGILAVFNCSNHDAPITRAVNVNDFSQIKKDEYIVYSVINTYCGELSRDDSWWVTLSRDQFDVLIFSPIRAHIAVIGFIDKWMSPCAVLSCDVDANGNVIAKTTGGGVFAFVSRRLEPINVEVDGEEVGVTQNPKNAVCTVDLSSYGESTVVISS